MKKEGTSSHTRRHSIRLGSKRLRPRSPRRVKRRKKKEEEEEAEEEGDEEEEGEQDAEGVGKEEEERCRRRGRGRGRRKKNEQKMPLSALHEPLHWRADRDPKAEMLSL